MSAAASGAMRGLVTRATDEMARVLGNATDRSWDAPAGDLEWTCRATVQHVADDLFSYASQVIAAPSEGYLPIEVVLDPQGSNDDILRAVQMCGQLLEQAAQLADDRVRAWHPHGTSDPAGFAAMGVVEVLVHTHDLTRGLGLEWSPPDDLAAPVLDRLFPGAPDGLPGLTLLYCCGRTSLEGHPRLTSWRWDSSVPGDTPTSARQD